MKEEKIHEEVRAPEDAEQEDINKAGQPDKASAAADGADKQESADTQDPVETYRKQAEEYKDKWMRNVAEFDNYKKRNARLWQEAYNEGISSVILKILSVGDNLDRALTMGLDKKTEDGIRNIRKKFDETLYSLGIDEINPVGEIFDPNVSEAVMQVAGEEGEESDTVKQVFEKGYRLKEKIIRYAKVSVVK